MGAEQNVFFCLNLLIACTHSKWNGTNGNDNKKKLNKWVYVHKKFSDEWAQMHNRIEIETKSNRIEWHCESDRERVSGNRMEKIDSFWNESLYTLI